MKNILLVTFSVAAFIFLATFLVQCESTISQSYDQSPSAKSAAPKNESGFDKNLGAAPDTVIFEKQNTAVAMDTRTLSFKISPSIGSVSGECIVPEKSKCIMTLAHGAGAGMNHAFMVALAQSLSEAGIATLRFNFPFVQNKKGRPDTPAVAHATIETAISKAREMFPKLPLFAAGKSFGGRMTSQYLSAHSDAPVKGIIFYGFPLHPAGKPSTERAEHLKNIKIPMLFLQGTRDELATWDLIESTCSTLPSASLIKIEGADHSFKAGKQNIIQLLANETEKWVDKNS
jgi:predicted alpha/beta-hydrolase family hydrolase